MQVGKKLPMFYYPIKLHYSQTLVDKLNFFICVLLPYKITLLSNGSELIMPFVKVLLPYKITLLSNAYKALIHGVWFYYPIKLHYSQTA